VPSDDEQTGCHQGSSSWPPTVRRPPKRRSRVRVAVGAPRSEARQGAVSASIWRARAKDDGQDDHDADEVRGGPNRALSLTMARANFQAMGACDERCMRFVRPPLSTELPKSSNP
jgi:Cysteine-rich CPCC